MDRIDIPFYTCGEPIELLGSYLRVFYAATAAVVDDESAIHPCPDGDMVRVSLLELKERPAAFIKELDDAQRRCSRFFRVLRRHVGKTSAAPDQVIAILVTPRTLRDLCLMRIVPTEVLLAARVVDKERVSITDVVMQSENESYRVTIHCALDAKRIIVTTA